MKYVSREEFQQRFPRKERYARELSGEQHGDLTVDQDTRIRSNVDGNVRIRSGVQVSLAGIIRGTLTIEPDATVYVTGVVEGDLRVDGNALLIGVVQGTVDGSEAAILATGDKEWH